MSEPHSQAFPIARRVVSGKRSGLIELAYASSPLANSLPQPPEEMERVASTRKDGRRCGEGVNLKCKKAWKWLIYCFGNGRESRRSDWPRPDDSASHTLMLCADFIGGYKTRRASTWRVINTSRSSQPCSPVCAPSLTTSTDVEICPPSLRTPTLPAAPSRRSSLITRQRALTSPMPGSTRCVSPLVL